MLEQNIYQQRFPRHYAFNFGAGAAADAAAPAEAAPPPTSAPKA
jgi:hypothetical protein